jgi:hypothetical protein
MIRTTLLQGELGRAPTEDEDTGWSMTTDLPDPHFSDPSTATEAADDH